MDFSAVQARTGRGAQLHEQWAALAEATGATPFAHPGWVTAWADSRGAEVEVLQVWRDGSLTAALPVVTRRRLLATPTDWHTPHFQAVAADRAALERLADVVIGRRPRHLRLGFLDPVGETYGVFCSLLRAAGYRLTERTVLQSPYLRLAGGWGAYHSSLPSKLRADLRRRRRRLDERGAVAFEIHEGRAGLNLLLTEGFEVEASGWKGEQGTAILAEGTESLYRQAASWAAEKGWLRLGFLRVDGLAIAFDYAFELTGIHYLVKTGFRQDYAAFAPGKLLRAHMIERAHAEGLAVYDFVGDADPWKREWADETRAIVTLDAYHPGPGGTLALASDAAARNAARAARHLARPRSIAHRNGR